MKTRTKIKKSHKSFKTLSDKLSPSAEKAIKEKTKIKEKGILLDINDLPSDYKKKQKNSGLGVEISKSGAILLLIGLMLLSSISLVTVHSADGVKAYYAPLLI